MFDLPQLAAMSLSAAVSLGLPVALAVLWRRRTRAPLSAAAAGAAMFFLSALVLEQLLHLLVLRPGGFVLRHTWAYVLYGALAAGVFEETGRWMGFRFLLKKQEGRETAVQYGIGHGGIEAMLLGGIPAVSSLAAALLYNAGALTGDLLAAVPAALAAPAPSFLTVGAERTVTVCFHIALSVLVFQAVKRPGRGWLYPAAIALHAGVDVFAALYQRSVLAIWPSELLMALCTAAVCAWAFHLYRTDVPADSRQVSAVVH